MMKEVDPKGTSRAYAFGMWMDAPMPMVTFIKTLDVSRLVRMCRRNRLKFNMLMLWCVARTCENHDITDRMVIGTSALARYDIDGAVGMYSGMFNNPFMIWGRYRKHLFKTLLTVSFQFHHTQMDGAHAARFLERLQKEISGLKV